MSKDFKKFVDGAKNYVCGLYRLQPKALIPNLPNDVLRYTWDNLCDPPSPDPTVPPLPGLPPPPSSVPNGGQCVCIKYRVEVRYEWQPSPASNPAYSSITQFFEVYGPVLGFRRAQGVAFGLEANCRGPGSGSCKTPGWYGVGGGATTQRGPYNIVSTKRVDNQVDNCGSSPPDYPGVDPMPPTGYTSPPSVITLGDTTNINVTFNITPPVAPPRGLAPPPIKVNVDGSNFNFPITFNFNGDVDIGPPAGPTAELPPDVIDKINNINNNTNNINPTVNNINTTTNNTNNIVNTWFNPTPFANDPDVESEESPVGDGKEEDKEGMLGLLVVLTALPDKVQYGNPPVYFAGWIAFKRDEGYMPREQINFEQSFFLAPPGTKGYTITLTNKAEGVVTVYSSTS